MARENSPMERSRSAEGGVGGRDEDAVRRDRIYQAAIPLLERFGFKKTTVGEVCRDAGISKRTFYDLFSDKEDLLRQMVSDMHNERTRQWEESLDPDLDPVGRLASALDHYASVKREYPFLQVLFEDLDVMRAFAGWAEDIRLSQPGGPMDRILRDGMASGDFRPLDPGAALWVVLGLLDTVYYLIPRLMDTPGALEDPALANEVKHFILWGLGAGDRDAPGSQRADEEEGQDGST